MRNVGIIRSSTITSRFTVKLGTIEATWVRQMYKKCVLSLEFTYFVNSRESKLILGRVNYFVNYMHLKQPAHFG